MCNQQADHLSKEALTLEEGLLVSMEFQGRVTLPEIQNFSILKISGFNFEDRSVFCCPKESFRVTGCKKD